MIFKFLLYLKPTSYFRLRRKNGRYIYPKYESLPERVKHQLICDENYTSKTAKDYDLAWQAIQQGYIGNADCYTDFVDVSVYDNYVFSRKYFHKAWVGFILLVRLVSLKNPFKEIEAFFSTRHIKRTEAIQPIRYPTYQHFNGNLLAQQPKVSVIIPTLNRYDYLKDVLFDLERQDYMNFEVVVVDQSEPFEPDFYKSYNLDIILIRQEEKALWLARNTAIKNAHGSLIALSEDDVRIQPDWISLHLKCLAFFDAQVSAGVFYPLGGNIPENRSHFALASQFATGNAIIYKSVFKTVGLFDRQFEKQRMGDGEFGNRIYYAGIRSVSNPLASCIDVKAGTGGLREMGSWDAFRPTNWFAPRPIPSVLYYFRRYFGKRAAIIAVIKAVPLSVLPYRFKTNKMMMPLGLLLFLILLPLVILQVTISWRLSSKKIKQGAIIERLY